MRGKILLLVLGVLSTANLRAGTYSGGTGEPNDPYRIATPNDLNDIGNHVEDFNKGFIMVNDIDLSAYDGNSFNIIGDFNNPFTGVFDGNGHSISNFTYICDEPLVCIGLIGHASSGAEIRKVILVDPNVVTGGGSRVGSLAGMVDGAIVQDCNVYSCNVSGGYYGNGGLVGTAEDDSVIVNCYCSGTISGDSSSLAIGGLIGKGDDISINGCSTNVTVRGHHRVGGILGINSLPSHIVDCHSSGSVQGEQRVGGLVGNNSGNISNSDFTGIVEGVGTGWYVGGLAGYHSGDVIDESYCIADVSGGRYVGGLLGKTSAFSSTPTMHNSYFEGNVYGTDEYVGGLTGSNSYTVRRCYSTGTVSGNIAVGGLFGSNGGEITDCYSLCATEGANTVGGLIGINHDDVARCYSAGAVDANTQVGGLIGVCDGGAVSDCFWDIETSGQTTSCAGTGKTTTQMQSVVTYWPWVPTTEWTIDDGNDYPHLAWENAPGEPITAPTYGGGTGRPEDPYLIYTAEQLNAIGLYGRHCRAHFKLMADIDLRCYMGEDFSVIGLDTPFAGVFDGNCHSISNLSGRALFWYVDGRDAEIKSLCLIDPNIGAGDIYYSIAGSLVRRLDDGMVRQCHVENGRVMGGEGDAAGGLIGLSSGEVRECSFSGVVSTAGYSVGGLVGYTSGDIGDCYASGTVSGHIGVGGLAGYNAGHIINSYSRGRVYGEDFTGGMVGNDPDSGDLYTSCFWDSDVNPDMNGIGDGNDPNVVGKTTAEMQTESTFTDAGWDFVGETINGPNDVWDICGGTNYPRLAWSIPQADLLCPDGVNFIDYSYFADVWNTADPNADFDLSGLVDPNDLKIFCDHWLEGM